MMLIGDSIVELHSTTFYKMLLQSDAGYAKRITQFVREITPILATTEQHFPYYTRHDAHHGFRVVRRMEEAIDKLCLQADTEKTLRPAEIFLLIAAAYAHDLGMTVFPDESSELLSTLKLPNSLGWKTNANLQTYLRREHSRRGGEYIHKNAEKLGVPHNLVHALDTMMRAHNFAVAKLDTLNDVYAAQERELDVRQLAAIVCVGDALEFSDTRVMEGVLDRLKIDGSDAARVSYRENMKHVCIGDSLAIDVDGRVIASGTFDEESVLALAHHTLDQMEEWIQGYCDIDRHSKFPRLRIRPEAFLRNLAFRGGRFERLGIRLNKRSVIDLIASNAVWRSNAGIAIRELVQNAVEACRYRAHHSAAADRYEPAVRVHFNRTDRTVTVLDNGCGMSERTILNNLLTVGNSRAKDADYTDTDYAPIARFGIGFWSVFTIAKTACVETAAFEIYRGKPAAAANAEGCSFEISLEELRDYTLFKSINRACGTQVVLELRDEVVFDDVFTHSQAMLLCSAIPVTFVLDDQEIEVPRAVPEVPDTAILGTRDRLKDDFGVRIFRWHGVQGDTELSVGFAYRMDDGKATFLATLESSLLNVLGGIRSHRMAVCGFAVPLRLEPLCIDLGRVGALFANHRSPKGFEFSLDRQQLLPNAAAEVFARDVTDLFHKGYREFLSATSSQDAATIAALRVQSEMHGGNTYDQFTNEELRNAAERFPDLMCIRLFPVSIAHDFAQSTPTCFDLEKLRGMSGVLFTLQKTPESRAPGSANFLYMPVEHESALRVVYNVAQRLLTEAPSLFPVYVVEANRLGSMLFDADPESSVIWLQHGIQDPPYTLCIQTMNLERASFVNSPSGILTTVQGRWTGTIYLRYFEAPDGKPYVFLGRYRVLIQDGSRLASHLKELLIAGRRIRLAEIIAQLHEDEQGFAPAELQCLLST